MELTKFKDGVYVSVCDGKLEKYGGHWRMLDNILFKLFYYATLKQFTVSDFGVGIFKDKQFGYSCIYYDGYQHSLWLGWFYIGWEGWSLFDEVDLHYPKFKYNK